MTAPVALITGGQQGIGLGIAKALGAAGFDLAIASLPALDDPVVQHALVQLGPKTRYVQHDMQDVTAVPALLERLGPVTAFVSNAGIPAPVRGDMLELFPQNFDSVMDINLRGAFFLAQAVARQMLATESLHYRSISFITSVSAQMASVERAEYCLSKAGASMMAQLFALRLAPHNIGVFELRPGIIETGMTAGVRDKYSARIKDGLVPAGRWGQPQDIGAVVVPLALGQMAFATGAVIPVDGGLSMQRL